MAVDAFNAGNDVLTMPADLDASYRAMLAAVQTGEISQERLDASVLKILAKALLGLEKNRVVDVSAISRLVGSPENIAIGQQISDASVTLVRDNGKLLPLRQRSAGKSLLVQYPPVKRQRPLLLIILCDNVRSEDGRALEFEIRKRAPDPRVIYLDPRIAAARSDAVLKAVDRAQQVVVAVYVVPSAARTRTVARGQKKFHTLCRIRQRNYSAAFLPVRAAKLQFSLWGLPISRRTSPESKIISVHSRTRTYLKSVLRERCLAKFLPVVAYL